MAATCERPSRIECIGRPRVEPSFLPKIIDHIMRVPDAAALATMRVLSRCLGRRVDRHEFLFALHAGLAYDGSARERLARAPYFDGGERYGHTYYNNDWIAAQGFDLASHERSLDAFMDGTQASLEGS